MGTALTLFAGTFITAGFIIVMVKWAQSKDKNDFLK